LDRCTATDERWKPPAERATEKKAEVLTFGVLGSAERKQRGQRPSEFSHGSGLVAPELADATPSEGGRYRGREASQTLGDAKIAGPAQRRAPRGSPTPRG
jgi:hypothetical protein